MRHTWMFFGLSTFTATVSAQTFTTIIDSDHLIDGTQTLASVDQVVLQDNNAVASIVRFDPNNFTPAITFNQTPGSVNASVVVNSGDTHSTFGVVGGNTFDDFYNLSSVNGTVSFISGNQASSLGLFRYQYAPVTPTKSTIHFQSQSIAGQASSLDTGGIVPTSYGINASANVAFSGRAISNSQQFIATSNGLTSTRIHDDSSTIDNFNETDSIFTAKKVITNTNHSVFVANDGTGRRIYDHDPVGPSLSVRVGASLQSGTYEPNRVIGATGSGTSGATFFRAFKNRANPNDDGFQNSALLVDSPNGLVELGAFDFSTLQPTDPLPPEPGGVISTNGRVAAFLPDLTGGSIVYYNSGAGGSPITVASFGTSVGGGFSIQDISIDNASVPMVNNNGTVVFDAVIANGLDVRDALLAWNPSLTDPFIVIKTDDIVNIGGSMEVVGQTGLTGSTFSSFGPAPVTLLSYDSDVLKDGLNENDFLAFGVRYDQGQSAAVLLTQVPEPAAQTAMALVCAGLLFRRRRHIS